jgi:uroporphyrinogen decarboxylase
MDKRELVLSLLEADRTPAIVPAAFFLHFDPARHFGQAAVDTHLEFFRATEMDFVKIQYELRFPRRPASGRSADWTGLPCHGEDFFAPQLDIVRAIVRAVGREAVVVATLYSPFMCACHALGEETVLPDVRREPEAVGKGMEIITASVLTFVRACVRLGVDGFYHSTQGGERHRLADKTLFDSFIRPFDLAVMREAEHCCRFNILHICDYAGEYEDLSRFRDYPGHVVSCPLKQGGSPFALAEAHRLFNRPVMGGLDRLGVIATGRADEIRAVVEAVLAEAPPRCILGADCTVPTATPWENLREAIRAAHACRRA